MAGGKQRSAASRRNRAEGTLATAPKKKRKRATGGDTQAAQEEDRLDSRMTSSSGAVGVSLGAEGPTGQSAALKQSMSTLDLLLILTQCMCWFP